MSTCTILTFYEWTDWNCLLFSNLRNHYAMVSIDQVRAFESRPSNKSANKLVRAAICLFCRKFISLY